MSHSKDDAPYVPTKQGRNERCLCNSGKKYKRCHGFVQHPIAPTGFAAYDGPGYVDLEELEKRKRSRMAVASLLGMVAAVSK